MNAPARFEFKYLVPEENLDDLRREIAPFVEKDSYIRPGCHEYTVRSIYMDTRSLDDYYQKLSGIQHRKKIRIRGYDFWTPSARVFLEIKRKNNMSVSKNRVPVPFESVEDLLRHGNVGRYFAEQNSGARAGEDARRFLFHVYSGNLQPIALICYEREAFFQKFDDSVRITFDKNLRSAPFPKLDDLFTDRGAQPSLCGYFTLEIKFFKHLPSWFQATLANFGLQREAVSKYASCLETHRIPETHTRESLLAYTHRIRPASAFVLKKPCASRGIGMSDL